MSEKALGSLPIDRLRAIEAELKRHPGAPVLLVVRQQPVSLGFLSGAGLIINPTNQPAFKLPTTKYVTDGTRKGRTLAGPMPIPNDALLALVDSTGGAQLIIGLDAVMQYAYCLFAKGGDTLGNMMRSLGLVFPETD